MELGHNPMFYCTDYTDDRPDVLQLPVVKTVSDALRVV